MLKTILLFIKTHAIATAISVTVVAGAVATPIVVKDIMLDNAVKNNLKYLASSNYESENESQQNNDKVIENIEETNNTEVAQNSQETNNNETIQNSQETNNSVATENNQKPENTESIETDKESESQKEINNNEPLTFKVKRIIETTESGDTSIGYKIVPSYDKDYSKWTKEEKEAYMKAWEEMSKIAEEDHKRIIEEEEQKLKEAEERIKNN